MKVKIYGTSKQMGAEAAQAAAEILNKVIAEKGEARLALSTGASQFETLDALTKTDVDFSRVTMFHLDEYLSLSISHPASFRKYLNERFISKVSLKKAFLVGESADCISSLSEEIRRAPIDLGLIGIGENAHIAFNDPPADFETRDAYIVVDLNEACKNQQVGEGWFANIDEVPKQAISMSVYQIMQCEKIISCVPFKVKANAVKSTLESPLSAMIPATMLKEHKDITLYLDTDSASAIDETRLIKGNTCSLSIEKFC